MTDIKQVSDWALTIAAEAAGSKLHHYERMADDNRLAQSIEAHARAIEQHEAFRQEVSEALKGQFIGGIPDKVARFIIAKPDPLVESVKDILDDDSLHNADEFSEAIRAALAKRNGRIVFDD